MTNNLHKKSLLFFAFWMVLVAKIASSMKNYYSIGYQTKIDPENTEERHIEVQIPNSKYIINARRTYSK